MFHFGLGCFFSISIPGIRILTVKWSQYFTRLVKMGDFASFEGLLCHFKFYSNHVTTQDINRPYDITRHLYYYLVLNSYQYITFYSALFNCQGPVSCTLSALYLLMPHEYLLSVKRIDLYRIYILRMSLNCCVHIIILSPPISQLLCLTVHQQHLGHHATTL